MMMSERVRQLRRARTPFVHATVVRAQQPTSAHPGDEAILLSDGTIEGFVGGECAQNSVRKAALGRTAGGRERAVAGAARRRRALPGGAGRVRRGQSRVCPAARSRSSLTPEVPAPLIGIRGATPIADALRRHAAWCSATTCNATMTMTRRRPTAVVIATHGGPEAEIIRAALDAGVGYVGLVASKTRGGAILDAARAHRCRAAAGAHPGRAADRRKDAAGDRRFDTRRGHSRYPSRTRLEPCPGHR